MVPDTLIILTARNEADRIGATLRALAHAFPQAPVWVADDGSSDGTPEIARAAGARVVRSGRTLGKGGAATLAAREALAWWMAGSTAMPGNAEVLSGAVDGHERLSGVDTAAMGLSDVDSATVVILCDGDLGESAALLAPLADAVRAQAADLAVAAFQRRVGGGFGVAVGFARWAIRRRCGLTLQAPISGQRALRADALGGMLPFAHGFGMEIGMTLDAARAGLRVVELPLELHHRATGRTLSGFVHRGRQLMDIARAYSARRWGGPRGRSGGPRRR